jgi:Eco57I restriction-modification methylase
VDVSARSARQQAGIPGLKVRDLLTLRSLDSRFRGDPGRWQRALQVSREIGRGSDWRSVLTSLGYDLERRHRGRLARFEGWPVAVVHPMRDAAAFARLAADGRPPEGVLLNDCKADGAPFGILASATRLRLFRADPTAGSASASYLDLDAAALRDDDWPFLALLGPEFLAQGQFAALQEEARSFGMELRRRLDETIRQSALPVLGRELGQWARAQGMDPAADEVREELERAALTLVFRVLFLLYAESAGYLPMENDSYHQVSLTSLVAEAVGTRERLSERSTSLWDRLHLLVKAMRTGNPAWAVPAYGGALFSEDGFEGSATLERVELADPEMATILTGLGRDSRSGEGVDRSALEIGHLGHIYEGLLSLRLSLARTSLRYDTRADRYMVPDHHERADVQAGDLLWQTHEGGRKRGGVYYTRPELVRHLVRQAVVPAFRAHLDQVRKTAETDPANAAEQLFDFAVLDPACGSAHFLVVVVDELADMVVRFLGETPLPQVSSALDRLRVGAGRGITVEDVALLRRLVLKRCVFGVDVSAMGAEVAKLSLWLASFVPGLPLAYLDRSVVVGNSLIGAVRPSALRPPGHDAQRWFLEDALSEALDGPRILHRRSNGLVESAEAVARRHAFLHWPLAFPGVFTRPRPGFDAVVGNPPWNEVTVERLAFYALFAPGLRSLPEAPRHAATEELLGRRPDLGKRLATEQDRAEAERHYLGAGEYASMPGDPDLYKFFCQRYRALLRDRGRLGVVLPRTAFAADGSEGFRRWLFEESTCDRIDFLLNRRSWIFDTHPQYTIALVAAERDTPSSDHRVRVAGTATSLPDWERQAASPGLALPREAFGPGWTVPLLRSQAEADLLAKLRRGSRFPHGASGRWRCFPVRELDETNDRHLWLGATQGRPLWKGESFEQYDPHGAEARCCPSSNAVQAKVKKPRPGAGSSLAVELSLTARRQAVLGELGHARVAFRDVSRATDSRTVRACLVPPTVFLTNKAPYLAFAAGDDRARASCLGIMNSLAFDWQARRFVEINLNFFILEGLVVPDLSDEDFAAVSSAGARLSCVDERFAEFAESVGVEPGPLDDEERERLRVEIDARVARAWSLTSEDLEVVLSDFTPAAVSAGYRRRLLDRLRQLA